MGYLLKLARGGGLFSGVSSYGGGEPIGQAYSPAYTSAPDLSISKDPQADVNAYISDLIMKYKSQYTTANGNYGLGYTDEDVMDKVMPEIQNLVASGKLPANMVSKALSSETLIDQDTLSNPKYQIPGVQTGGNAGKQGAPGAKSVPSAPKLQSYKMHYSPKKKLEEQSGYNVDTATGKRVATPVSYGAGTITHPKGVKPRTSGNYVRDPETGVQYTAEAYAAMQQKKQTSQPAAPTPAYAPVTAPTPAAPAAPAPVAAPKPALGSLEDRRALYAKAGKPAAPAPASTPVPAPVAPAPALAPKPAAPAPAPIAPAPASAPVAAPAPKKVSRRQQYLDDGWQMDNNNTYGKNWMYKDNVGADGKTTRTYLSPRHRKAGRGGIQVELPSAPKANTGRQSAPAARR